MFKNKFKETVQDLNLKDKNFEIISSKKLSTLIGGCGKLQSCGVFTGSCDRLVFDNCGRFRWTLSLEEA